MKKSFRRIFFAMMCLLLCLALGVSALAEGPLAALFQSASKLAFDTSNVTLNAKATFKYDGELFKVLNGDYVQDGARSFLKIMLDTPKEDGSIYTGGYTVIGEGLYAYAIDTYNNGYYTESNTDYSTTLLRKNAQTDSLVNFGALLLELAESTMDGVVTVSPLEKATQYAVKLAEGQTPQVLNAALSLLALNIADKRYGISTGGENSVSNALVWVEDWDGLNNTIYKELYGEEMPVDFFTRLYSNELEYDEYSALDMKNRAIQQRINELQNEQRLLYTDGVTIILFDGSAKHYDTREEYYLDNDGQFVTYVDYTSTFKAYYKEKTGAELTDEIMDAIYLGANEELSNAYYDMQNEMYDHYIALVKAAPKAVSAEVNVDGTYTLIYKMEDDQYQYSTVKERILRQMTALELATADCSVSTDAEGRIVSGEGSVTLNVVDAQGTKHPLEIVFNAAASEYGTSAVKDFDPADYDVVHVSEFFYAKYGEESNEPDAEAEFDAEGAMVEPVETAYTKTEAASETVVFNGKEYTVPKN